MGPIQKVNFKVNVQCSVLLIEKYFLVIKSS